MKAMIRMGSLHRGHRKGRHSYIESLRDPAKAMTGKQQGPAAGGGFVDVGSGINFRRAVLQVHFLLSLLKNLQGCARWPG